MRAPVPVDRCGMARASELIGDRWTLLILREAFYGVTRFADLRADLAAPRAVLSQRLDQLVQEEILQRHPYQDEGSRTRYDYRLTEKGRELALVLFALMQWGDRYLRNDPAPLQLVDGKTGDPLTVALVTRTGRVVPVTKARAVAIEQR
jgi:DNA-binding HxlR family transcriptional regulator